MRRSSLFTPIAVLALALGVFGAWMHWAILMPRNIGWLLDGNDRGQSALGLAAYLRDGAWPSLHQPLLGSPEGATLLFTDSIPLLGLLLRPFATWLPDGAQYVGVWYLACLILHAGFAHALVRRHASDALGAWLGAALLTLMPALFNRYGHASLCAQWLILWGLWIFVDPCRARRPLWWMAVLGTAALVHSYLLVMVAAIWASAVLCALLREEGRGGTVLRTIPVLALVGGVLWWLGALGGGFASTHTYGQYPMALDAWWNPANPGYTALLPSSPDRDALGFEGLQYLGAGLLALVVVAVVVRVRSAGDGVERATLARLMWLLPAFAVLLLVAIGPAPVVRGAAIFAVRLPAWLVDTLDPVRAGGRLAWPVTYTLAFAAIVVACRLKRATLVLAAALALQIVDLAPMLGAIRATTARADDQAILKRTRDPRWQGLIAGASSVEFEPADPFRDAALLQEVSWQAIRACRPVRLTNTSRRSQAMQARIDADGAAFRAGAVDPTRLYVMLDGLVPPRLAARTLRLDGVTVIPPLAPAPSSDCVSAAGSLPPSSPRSAS